MENIVFYLLNINTKESYSKFYEYIDYLNKYNISAYQNQFFQYEAMGLDCGQLVYISIENEDVFLEILDKCKIEAEKKDILSDYNIWLKKRTIKKERLKQINVDETTIEIIHEESFPKIYEALDGSQYLTEETIIKKDKIRIYTNSNEQTGHHIPHVHIQYNEENNFCVVSLIDLSIIEPKGNPKTARIKKCINLLEIHINKARLAWNKTSGNIKFKVENGEALVETYKI